MKDDQQQQQPNEIATKRSDAENCSQCKRIVTAIRKRCRRSKQTILVVLAANMNLNHTIARTHTTHTHTCYALDRRGEDSNTYTQTIHGIIPTVITTDRTGRLICFSSASFSLSIFLFLARSLIRLLPGVIDLLCGRPCIPVCAVDSFIDEHKQSSVSAALPTLSLFLSPGDHRKKDEMASEGDREE